MDTLAVGVAVAVVLVTCALLYIFLVRGGGGRVGGKGGSLLLLLGPMNAGKTVLFFKLRNGDFRDTHTSAKPNDDTLLDGVRTVDFPGHPRKRLDLPPFLNDARAIVFVVDASDPDSWQAAGEQLFDVMSSSLNTPILVACSKTDAEDAQSLGEVQAALDKVFDTKREFQHSMQSLADDGDAVGEPLEALEDTWAEFASFSSKLDDLTQITQFVERHFGRK